MDIAERGYRLMSQPHLKGIATRNTARLILMLVTVVANTFANSQSSGSDKGSGPVHIVSNSEFKTLVKSGKVTVVSPTIVLGQYLQRKVADIKNRAVVDKFICQNPKLTNFARMVKTTPTGPNVFSTVDGDYRWVMTNSLGTSQVIQTQGQGTKLAGLARSIQASSDPVQQLALYTSFYSKYTTLYNQNCRASAYVSPGCAGLIPPSGLTDPVQLQDASLEVIQISLGAIGALGPSLIHLVPPVEIGPAGCGTEIGASTAADNVSFGDQTRSTCNVPSAGGILGNFNWVNKNLLSCVKNQGQRGLCHIFAATSAVEELIARDTGVTVNLSEQDFTENKKLIWDPDFFHDGGDPYEDLQNAASFGYKFAYENQWDYNPSLNQPSPPSYEFLNSCDNYPSSEPACSYSTPQAPLYCTPDYSQCGFTPAAVSGVNSPYGSPGGGSNVWNPNNPFLSVNDIQLALAFNDAVLLAFNVTNKFQGAPGGYVPFDLADLFTSLGGHQAHIVGYVSNADLAANSGTANAPPGAGGGYFIIKNSWGTCAGDAGYYYMPVDYLIYEATQVLVIP